MNSECPSCHVDLQNNHIKLARTERYFSKVTHVYQCNNCSSEIIKNVSKDRQNAGWAVFQTVIIITILTVTFLWYLFPDSVFQFLTLIGIFAMISGNVIIKKIDKTPDDWAEWKLK